jgi:hypothetical protein
MKVVFNWYLREAFGLYARFDEDEEDPDLQWTTHAVLIPNTLTIRGTDFDPDTRTYEGQFVIPIGELYSSSSGWMDNMAMIFRMGTELVTDEGTGRAVYWTDEPMGWAIYGDFFAAVDEALDDNLLEGAINTDFLERKTIALDVFDSSWNYRNALKIKGMDLGLNYGWFNLSNLWSWDSGNYDTLARKLMESKFRLYRVGRQKITLRYNTKRLARPLFYPLALFYDNKQSDKTFIMTYHLFRPDKDEVVVELWEYDNAETINLI